MRISDWSSDVCSSDLLSVVVETSDTPSLRALVSSKGIDPSALQLETSADVARQSLERVAAGPTFFLGEAHSEPVNANARRKRTEAISAFLGNFYGSADWAGMILPPVSGAGWQIKQSDGIPPDSND